MGPSLRVEYVYIHKCCVFQISQHERERMRERERERERESKVMHA